MKESLNLNIFSLEHLFWIVQTWGQQNDDHDDESDYDDDDKVMTCKQEGKHGQNWLKAGAWQETTMQCDV